MDRPLILGIDLGTQQFKAMVVAPATGRVLSRATGEVHSSSSEPGMMEQRPNEWEELLFTVTQRAIQESGAAMDISAIGVSGHMHTLLALDGNKRPVHDAIAWNDTRAAHTAKRLERFEPLWNPPIAAYTLPKLIWLREQKSGAASRVRTVMYPKDYLRLCLTGQTHTDPSDASGSLIWDFPSRTFDRDLLDRCGFANIEMPEVVPSNTVAGTLTPEAAKRLGLQPDLPVATGAGDVAAAVIGARVTSSDTVLINAGTAAQVITVYTGNRTDILNRRRQRARVGYLFELGLDDSLFIMGALPSAGHSLAWWRAVQGNQLEFSELDAIAEGKSLEPDGALFLPYLQGTGTPHMVDAGLAGFVQISASEDFGRLTRAVIDGIAMGIRHVLDSMAENQEVPSTIVVTGGLGRSRTFCRTLATLVDRNVEVRQIADVSCIGAAYTALSATDRTGATGIQGQVPSTTYRPDMQAHDLVEARYTRFKLWTRAAIDTHTEPR